MSVYLSIVAGAIKLFNYMAAALQQHHDELNGVTAQKEATDAATIKELENVAAPTSDAERDRLWNLNKSRYGVNIPKTGK